MQCWKNIITFSLFPIRSRKKWLPQQFRKLSHGKSDKLPPVEKSLIKKGSEKKSKVHMRDYIILHGMNNNNYFCVFRFYIFAKIIAYILHISFFFSFEQEKEKEEAERISLAISSSSNQAEEAEDTEGRLHKRKIRQALPHKNKEIHLRP